MFFFNNSLIAMDIGSSSIKVVELVGKGEKKLKKVGMDLLPHNSIIDGVIQDLDAVEDTAIKLVKRLQIITAGRRVALSLGGSTLMVKTIFVDAEVEDEELSEQISAEAEQNFQQDIEDIYFDYYRLSEQPDEFGKLPVVIVGAKREVIDSYIQVVHSTGMKTGVIDCDIFGTINMFEHNYGAQEGLTGIVNVGASLTQLALVNNGQYVYSRDVPLGGDDYTQRIMDLMGVDKAQADSVKIIASQGEGDSSQDATHAINQINEQMVSELQMTLDYFFQSGEAMAVTDSLRQVFLTGGSARVLGLDAAVAAAMQVPVQILNPFKRIEVDPDKFPMDYILTQGHLFGVSVGLGLRVFGDEQDRA